jgi:hypothetical protein
LIFSFFQVAKHEVYKMVSETGSHCAPHSFSYGEDDGDLVYLRPGALDEINEVIEFPQFFGREAVRVLTIEHFTFFIGGPGFIEYSDLHKGFLSGVESKVKFNPKSLKRTNT